MLKKSNKILKLSSWQRILISMVLGVVFGLYFGDQVEFLGVIGNIFLNLLKMVTVPLVFFTIIYGITNIESDGKLYKVSLKAILAFLVTAIIAVLIGMVTSTILQPGVGIDISSMIGNASSITSVNKPLTEILVNIVPTNIISSLAEGNVLQVIIFSFFVGAVMQIKKQECQELIKICHQISKVLFTMVELIMKIAPIGVFGYIASVVGSSGINIFVSMTKLVITVFIACGVQYFVFGLLILLWAKISPIPFYRKMLEPQLLAFSTSSSKATLVPLMNIAENKIGISRQNSRFLLPLSATLNMDGGAIYQSVCAIFFSQALGINLTITDYATLIVMCTIASIGGAGIPGGVLLFLGMVLQSVGIPIDGVLIITAIDRILDMVTTMINITGDACITLLIDSSEKTFNKELYYNCDKSNENTSI